MKPLIVIWLLFTLISYSGQAQYSQGARDSAQNEIRQLTHDWNNAIVTRDSLVLDKILGPEYTLNGSVNRDNWMNNTMHHFDTDTLMNITPLVITFFGQAAKSEGGYFWKASYDGKPRINADYQVTDIWIKRNGQWQVMMRMSIPSKTK